MTVRAFYDGRTNLVVNFQIEVACVYAYPNHLVYAWTKTVVYPVFLSLLQLGIINYRFMRFHLSFDLVV